MSTPFPSHTSFLQPLDPSDSLYTDPSLIPIPVELPSNDLNAMYCIGTRTAVGQVPALPQPRLPLRLHTQAEAARRGYALFKRGRSSLL